MSTSLHLPARILKVYIKALSGFSHFFRPYGLNNTLLSQGYVLETAPGAGILGRTCIPRTGAVEEPQIAWVQLMGQLVATSSR